VGARRVSSAAAPNSFVFKRLLHSSQQKLQLQLDQPNPARPAIYDVPYKKLTPKEIKQREMNNPAWTVRTLSVPGDDTDLTLWVSFDNARFCFGAGEGTQRAFIQKSLRMGGLQAIFLPDGVSGRGGLPGR